MCRKVELMVPLCVARAACAIAVLVQHWQGSCSSCRTFQLGIIHQLGLFLLVVRTFAMPSMAMVERTCCGVACRLC